MLGENFSIFEMLMDAKEYKGILRNAKKCWGMLRNTMEC